MENFNQLELELKEFIVCTLALEDIRPEEIDSEAPLVGDGLGLDSIDVLELGAALKKRYGIALDGDSEETRSRFASVRNLARFVYDEKRALHKISVP